MSNIILGLLLGILRGAGKQLVGSVANVVAYYAIGLPMAWYLCFNCGLGVKGLMIGVVSGTLFQDAVMLILVFGFEDYVYKIPNEAVVGHADNPEIRETEMIYLPEAKKYSSNGQNF